MFCPQSGGFGALLAGLTYGLRHRCGPKFRPTLYKSKRGDSYVLARGAGGWEGA